MTGALNANNVNYFTCTDTDTDIGGTTRQRPRDCHEMKYVNINIKRNTIVNAHYFAET